MPLIQIESAGLGMLPLQLSMDEAPMGSGGGAAPMVAGAGFWNLFQRVPTMPRPQPQMPWWVRRRRFGRPLPPVYTPEGRTPTPMPIPVSTPILTPITTTISLPTPTAPVTPVSQQTSSMFATSLPSASSMFATPAGSGMQATTQSVPNALSGIAEAADAGKSWLAAFGLGVLATLAVSAFITHRVTRKSGEGKR